MHPLRQLRTKIRYYDPRVWYLFIARVFNATGFGIVLPFLSIYLYQEKGVPMSIVGAIFLFAAVTRAVFQYIGGQLTDRHGRRAIMLVGSSGRAVMFFLLALVVYWGTNFWWIAVGVVGSYGFGAMFFPAADAMVADVVSSHDRVEVYAIQRIGVNLGWAIGPALGGLLSHLPFYLLFVLTGFFFIFTFFFVFVFVHESYRGGTGDVLDWQSLLHFGGTGAFWVFCIFTLVVFSVMNQFVSTLSVYSVQFMGISKMQVGFLFTINGLLIVLFQFPISKLIRRIRLTSALTFGAAMNGIAYLFIPAFQRGFWAVAGTIALVTLGEMFVTPSGAALISRWAPEGEKGRYFGIYGLFMSFGRSIGPFYGGVLLDVLQNQALALWGIISGLGFSAAAGFFRISRFIPARANRE